MTTRCAAMPGAEARDAFDLGANEKIAVSDIMAVQRDGAASDRRLRERPAARVRAGAERLRPSLHLLHHPLWPRQFALGADGRGGRSGAARWSKRGHAEIVLTGVDLTSYGADLPGAPKLGMLTKQILRACAGAEAAAHLLDRFDRGRRRSAGCASPTTTRLMPHLHLSLQSGDDMILKRMKRRHSRQRCDRVLRPGAAPAAGHRLRRRHHRRLSDRDRGDVLALARSGRGMRPDLPARLSLFAAPRHAGRADAAGRRAERSRSARSGCARRAKPRCGSGCKPRSARRATC